MLAKSDIIPSVMKAHTNSASWKTFALNLSAPFIPQFFGVQLQQILPYCDVVIGNETEAEAWATATGLPNKELPAIAKALALLPKVNPSRPRIVIFTQGPKSTVLVSSAEPDSPKIYDVNPLGDDKIVDTNGAGDAFAGGFIGALVAGKSLDECVEVGHKLGAMCVQQVYSSSVISNDVPANPNLGGRSSIPMAKGQNPLNGVRSAHV
jgi:adenosine kinase